MQAGFVVVALDYRLLARVLRDPSELTRLSAEEFSRSIDAADAARLLGWLLERRREGNLPADPPGWLADRGGVLAPEFPERFAEFSAKVVRRLASGPAHVKWWLTLNEPLP